MTNPPDGQSNGSAHLNAIFSALADETRRHVLRYFISAPETATEVDDLVAYILAQDGTLDDPERIAIQFNHVTLPKLDEAGLLEYDARSDFVRYQEPPWMEAVWSFVTEMEDAESANPY